VIDVWLDDHGTIGELGAADEEYIAGEEYV